MTRPFEVLLFHMRGLTSSSNEWQSGFARSVLKQARRPNWRPTEKQIAIMDKMVAELFRETDDAFEVIEE
jgi:hypothetical protein